MDDQRQELLELCLPARPRLRDFVVAPTSALIVVTVEKCSVVTQSENVMEPAPGQ